MIGFPLDLRTLQTRVLQAGEGGRDVLFLHGAGARADRWAQTIQRMAKAGYRCFAIDFPGHGFATKGAATDYSASAFADFVASASAALQLRRPAVVGTSFGAHVAAAWALSEPQFVRGLALVGAVGLTPLAPEAVLMIAAGLTATRREQVASKLRIVLQDVELVTDALIEEEWRINTSAGAGDSFARFAEYWTQRHQVELVGPRLATSAKRPPIRLIWGAEDCTTPPAMGEAAARLLTEGELHLLPGGGHAPYLDVPEKFDAALLPFLESLDWSAL